MTNIVSLDSIANGNKCTVLSIDGIKALKRRIMDMGITKGVEVMAIKRAPMGDPIEIKVRGYLLTLRADDAKKILVEKVS